ncbi:MAG: sulfurtransferase [Lewinellaceae bacterium]|nr:sulfurtransferase [Lewinellaceae bacterium]
MYNTLISAEELAQHFHRPGWLVFDCRFNLADTGAGRRAYREAHIPGAAYLHLDDDLCAPLAPGLTGRHPLPPAEETAARFSRWGIGPDTQVVAYDDMSGAIAARLWWMLRWLGHEAAAVLDGGWPAWQSAGLPTDAEIPRSVPANFTANTKAGWTVDADRVGVAAHSPAYKVVDSRTPERYRGEVEPIDPVAGHIPGAVNYPHPSNVGPDGLWLSPETLRRQLMEVLGSTPPEHTVFYCGSGVTACRNILAYKYAGLGDALLYPGSWSEWIADGTREVATGGDGA